MKRIRFGALGLLMLWCAATSATAEVSIGIGIGLPNVSIGLNLPLFPELVPVPGYPVYYAPRVDGNYFFYDGMYWVYQNDNWYASSWYNGPWDSVGPDDVPLFILRVPVRYYRQHPVYFRGWRSDAPPRWGHHWGRDWEHRRGGWDRWDHRSAPAPAPLPVYQREYSGDRYPRLENQHELNRQKYRYEPRDTMVRQQSRKQQEQKAPKIVQRETSKEPALKSPGPRDKKPSASPKRDTPPEQKAKPPRRGGEDLQKSAPAPTPQQQRAPAEDQRQQSVTVQHDRKAPRAQKPSRGKDRDRDVEPEHGRERNN